MTVVGYKGQHNYLLLPSDCIREYFKTLTYCSGNITFPYMYILYIKFASCEIHHYRYAFSGYHSKALPTVITSHEQNYVAPRTTE
jgi:hypothetical protein